MEFKAIGALKRFELVCWRCRRKAACTQTLLHDDEQIDIGPNANQQTLSHKILYGFSG